jgi:hypothetical protein
MKLLSVGLARALWFLDVNDLNPGGKDIYTHLFPALLEDYKFKTYPKAGDDLSQGMKLMNGEFVKKDGTVLVVNCTVFNDGIAVDTFSSTADSEELLEEVLTGLPDLGFAYEPEMVRRKAYVSQVNVKCSKALYALNPRLADFAERISSAVSGTVFTFSAVEFWPDQTLVIKPANFSFQRKIGDPQDSDRYWSQAALPTDKHLELLEEFEALLS